MNKNYYTLMNKKTFYTAPEAEFLVVRFEENLLGSNDGRPGGDEDYNDQGEF